MKDQCPLCGEDMESTAILDGGDLRGRDNLKANHHEPGGWECSISQHNNKLKLEQESNANNVLCHEEQIKDLKVLLLEAADSVRASLAETDIFDARKEYRKDLEKRLRVAAKENGKIESPNLPRKKEEIRAGGPGSCFRTCPKCYMSYRSDMRCECENRPTNIPQEEIRIGGFELCPRCGKELDINTKCVCKNED